MAECTAHVRFGTDGQTRSFSSATPIKSGTFCKVSRKDFTADVENTAPISPLKSSLGVGFLIYILTEPPPRRDRSLTPAATSVVGRREAMRMSFLNNNHAPGRLP